MFSQWQIKGGILHSIILAKHFQHEVETGEIQKRFSEHSFIPALLISFRPPESVDVNSLTGRKDDQWFGDQSKV